MINEYVNHPSEAQGEDDDWPRCIMTVAEFLEDCEMGALIDYDGFGRMLTITEDGEVEHGDMWPSNRHTIPEHVTHIEWFNR